jgi:hypothetical protein
LTAAILDFGSCDDWIPETAKVRLRFDSPTSTTTADELTTKLWRLWRS